MVERELAHAGLSELIVVDSMHSRKARMAELAQGFIALPGGIGTYDELFEILTWAQLGIHPYPVGLLDVDGYFDPFRALWQRAADDGFLHFSLELGEEGAELGHAVQVGKSGHSCRAAGECRMVKRRGRHHFFVNFSSVSVRRKATSAFLSSALSRMPVAGCLARFGSSVGPRRRL